MIQNGADDTKQNIGNERSYIAEVPITFMREEIDNKAIGMTRGLMNFFKSKM